ncbi:hypothetical protein D3C86_2184710 [compost metagenome]
MVQELVQVPLRPARAAVLQREARQAHQQLQPALVLVLDGALPAQERQPSG